MLLVVFFTLLSACSSHFLKMEKKEEEFKKNIEFDEKVVIKELPAEVSDSNSQAVGVPPSPLSNPEPPALKEPVKTIKKKSLPAKAVKKGKAEKKAPPDEVATAAVAEPPPLVDIESKDGINGRRPIKDPFRVGEEVIHEMHYFKVAAGELRLKVGPFVEVNGRRSYTFTTELESSRMFSSFYSVQDTATTYVDYAEFVPHVFTLSVKETGQIKDGKGLFDIKNNKATYWEKKFTKKDGQEEARKEWDILPFSQNVYSAAYYMRLFKWDVGKEYSFRVADAGENIVFKGKAIRKEKIETEVGDFEAIVIKPEITVKGIFKPIGDIYFWLSDDDRKYILRIESSIKIGTIVSEVIKINPGKTP
ncbi:MAG: DUF3108 domain-containing protein [Bdellovibrionaceae bacterium]|nr:DUF3108 domain-containing protein [Pseudobdellovibrionaceae bacterium]